MSGSTNRVRQVFTVHPVIRIICLLVGAVFLAAGSPTVNLALAVALTLAYVATSVHEFRSLLHMLRRMRWLFLSMAVIYFWFTPGRLLAPSLAGWSPTVEGTLEGTLRISGLMLLAAAVNLLVQTTPRPRLLSAIHGIAAPLAWFGIPRERLAVRMVLALEAVPQVQALFVAGPRPPHGNAFRRIGDAAANLLRVTLDHAQRQPCQPIELPAEGAPPRMQWSYPLLLAGALFLIR